HLFERLQPGVLVKPASVERTVLPRVDLQLARAQSLLYIDTRLGESREVFFPSLGINEMEGFVAHVEAILNERSKDTVLLVDAVEESTNVTLPAEGATGKLHRMFV